MLGDGRGPFGGTTVSTPEKSIDPWFTLPNRYDRGDRVGVRARVDSRQARERTPGVTARGLLFVVGRKTTTLSFSCAVTGCFACDRGNLGSNMERYASRVPCFRPLPHSAEALLSPSPRPGVVRQRGLSYMFRRGGFLGCL